MKKGSVMLGVTADRWRWLLVLPLLAVVLWACGGDRTTAEPEPVGEPSPEAAPGAAGRGPAPAPAVLEPEAADILRRMSDHLAALDSFAFSTYQLEDVEDETGQQIQYSKTSKLVVRRPDRLYATGSGDRRHLSFWYDGSTVSALDHREKVYAVVEVPPDIDGMLDTLALEYGLVMPLADLLFTSPYESLVTAETSGRKLGVHDVQGTPCHHLVMRTPWLDWQIWIQAEGAPLPRKVVLTRRQQTGSPEHLILINDWDPKPRVSEAMFRFEAPKDAQQIEFHKQDRAEPGAQP